MASKGVLPPAKSLVTLSPADRANVLDLLFEPSPALHGLLEVFLATEEQASYSTLIEAIRGRLLALVPSPKPGDRLVLATILSSHPRLGAPALTSPQSAVEQASLGPGAETGRLTSLNERYEDKFGIRYVVFVNGRDRDVICADVERRIKQGTKEGERRAAVDAICDIARDRAKNLQRSEL